eukprot:gene21188-biopygen7106
MLCSGSAPRSAPPQPWLSPGSAAALGQHGSGWRRISNLSSKTHGHLLRFFWPPAPRDAAALLLPPAAAMLCSGSVPCSAPPQPWARRRS